MSDNLTYCFLALAMVLGPIWLVLHYAVKWRATRAFNSRDAAAFDQLAQTAARMEARMAVLERILDAEVPSWRGEYESVGGIRVPR